MAAGRGKIAARSSEQAPSMDVPEIIRGPESDPAATVSARSAYPTIRAATREDSAALARLITPLGYSIDQADVETVWSAWTAEGNNALVAAEQGSILGVVTLHRMTVLHRRKAVGRITSLAVDPTAQGRGIGRRLVEAAEAALAAGGCGLIEVTSHARRVEAHEFYEHLEFKRTGFRFARDLP